MKAILAGRKIENEALKIIAHGITYSHLVARAYKKIVKAVMKERKISFFLPNLSVATPLGTIMKDAIKPEAKTTKLTSRTVAPRSCTKRGKSGWTSCIPNDIMKERKEITINSLVKRLKLRGFL